MKLTIHVGKHGKISSEQRGHVVAWVPEEINGPLKRWPRSQFGRNVTEAIDDMKGELQRCGLGEAEVDWVDAGLLSGGKV